MIEPYTLLIVETCTGLAALVNVEGLDKFLQREHLLFCTRVPSQQSQEIDHSLGEVATLPVSRRDLATLGVVPLQREHREAQSVAVTLGELALTLGFEQQWQMGEPRHGILPSESLIQQHMERGTGQPLLAAYHMADLHEVVVHDIGQMICRQFIGTLEEHLVVYHITHDAHVAAYYVIHMHGLSWFHLEAHHILLTVGDELLHFACRHSKRVAHHHARAGIILEIGYLGTLGLEFGRGVKSIICLAVIEQLLYIFLIDVPTLTLPVWPVLSAV